MKTGSFFTTIDLPGRVSIARWAPKSFRDLPRLSALAPGAWFKSVDIPTYEKLYAEQLAELNPGAIWGQLHNLANGHGADIALLGTARTVLSPDAFRRMDCR